MTPLAAISRRLWLCLEELRSFFIVVRAYAPLSLFNGFVKLVYLQQVIVLQAVLKAFNGYLREVLDALRVSLVKLLWHRLVSVEHLISLDSITVSEIDMLLILYFVVRGHCLGQLAELVSNLGLFKCVLYLQVLRWFFLYRESFVLVLQFLDFLYVLRLYVLIKRLLSSWVPRVNTNGRGRMAEGTSCLWSSKTSAEPQLGWTPGC